MGSFIEDQVVVRLSGIRADRSPMHPDQPAVDRVRAVGHCPHKEQVAGGPRREVVLKGAEVEHLVLPSDEGGPELAGPCLPVEGGIGPEPGIPATQGHREAVQGGAGADHAGLVGQLPGVGPEGLHAHVGEGGVVGHTDFGHRDHQAHGGGRRSGTTRGTGRQGGKAGEQPGVGVDHDLDHARHRTCASPDDRAGEHGEIGTAADHMDDHDGIGDGRPGGDVDHQRVHREGIVQQYEVAGVGHHRAQDILRVVPFGGPAQGQQPVSHGGGHRGQHAVDGHHQGRAGSEAGDQ